MAKCNACGELNNEKSLFCSQCGRPLEKQAPSSEELNMDKARKEFEKDSQIYLDRSKITFVCELCGTINRIDSPRCVRCGKPRPRSEFVSALKKIKDADVVQQEYREKLEEEQRLLEEERRRAEEALIQDPLAETPSTIYRYEPKPQQNVPITQPFVVVPYVNTSQPLWQYPTTPQISRYVGEVESLSELQRLTKLKEERQRELEMKERLEAQRQMYGYDEAPLHNVQSQAISKKIKRGSVFTMLFALLTLIGIGVLAFFNFDILKGSFESLFKDFANYELYFIPVGLAVTLGFVLIAFVRSIVRVAKGKASTKGVLIALFVVIGAVSALLGALLQKGASFDNIESLVEVFLKLHYSYYIIVAGALLLFFTTLLCTKITKEKKRKK